LLGKKKLPNQLSAYIRCRGAESEAVEYAAETIHLWRKTEGVLDWLKRPYLKRKKLGFYENMTSFLKRSKILQAVQLYRRRTRKMYIVGGAIRDLILGRPLGKDLILR
jgi:hypothetical protein